MTRKTIQICFTDFSYIRHCLNKYKIDNFLLSAQNRMIDFYVKPIQKLDLEKKRDQTIEKHPKLHTAYPYNKLLNAMLSKNPKRELALKVLPFQQ